MPYQEDQQAPLAPLDVVIIGAGAAGLSAARALLASDPYHKSIQTVTIVEAASYVGGRVDSDDDFVPGFHYHKEL